MKVADGILERVSQLEVEARSAGIQARSVGGIVMRQGSTLILVRSAAHPFMPGCGDIPGGYALPTETLLEALARETKEETGSDVVAVTRYLEHFDFTTGRGLRARQFNFLIEISGLNVVLAKDEHSAFVWCDPTDIAELRHLRVSREVRSVLAKAVGI